MELRMASLWYRYSSTSVNAVMLTDAKFRGALVLLGGEPCHPGGLPGYFFQRTVLSNVSTDSLITHEEAFAPVFALYRFQTEEEAIEIANDCDVRLGSYLMTESVARIWRVAESLEVGMVAVNQESASVREIPAGNVYLGVKDQGMDVKVDGEELTSILQSRVS
ncbi:succinate-semialdehyde dehydrogenase (NADP+) [Fusarium oxysporum f. sp. pisi HDV247]|uniref:Succinate-semialdehyde dehydrogenase (NADP+) n=1 Tax=Fusarium oxysporum f. sp. pisi HDV247 TaxID=1080344 RepID=W9N898_FUSOX|nr:succinate-semialdehyde dehydrogenase (NADP+) [Fusarium oxysporum f. sp. pisi HDV247]